MKLRNVVSTAVGALGATAVANRLLSRRASGFGHALAGDRRSYRWRGFDVAYTEAGDPDDQDLVLLHGISAASSSHEFEPVFDALAEEYHVVAPDLPGFGHSDRPPLTYSASLYTSFVRDFLADTTDEPIVVASSLTGAYAVEAVADADVSRLVLVCPTADTVPGRRTWLRTLIRSPLVGQALFNLLVSERAIRYFNADHGYYDPSNVDDKTVEYEWTTAHQPGARFAPASFVSGHLDPDTDLADALADLSVPVTLVWGENADLPSLSVGRDLAQRADIRLVSVGRSKLLPHAEHPAEFVDVVREPEVQQRAAGD